MFFVHVHSLISILKLILASVGRDVGFSKPDCLKGNEIGFEIYIPFQMASLVYIAFIAYRENANPSPGLLKFRIIPEDCSWHLKIDANDDFQSCNLLMEVSKENNPRNPWCYFPLSALQRMLYI